MDKKTHNRLIQAARRISMGWRPRINVKQRCKVDKATYRCQKCGTLSYEGVNPVFFVELQEKYPNDKVVMDKFAVDHIDPVKPLDGSEHDWNVFYKRLFCGEENLRGLCKECHDKKSKAENKLRKRSKYGKSK